MVPGEKMPPYFLRYTGRKRLRNYNYCSNDNKDIFYRQSCLSCKVVNYLLELRLL